MKVLFITRKFSPSIGGMELFARDLSQALAAETDLELLKWGGHGRFMAVFVALPYLFFKAFFRLLRGGIDVIHIQDGLLAPGGRILAFIFRKPCVVVIHGLDITFDSPVFKLLVPRSVAKADAVICISRSAAEAAVSRGVPAEKISVIPLAVNDDIFGTSSREELIHQLDLPAESKLLLTVGRLVQRKGVEWFIASVLPGLAGQFPGIVYLVAGDGPARPDIEAAIARNHMENHVRLLGRVSPELLAAAYNGVDVFVMPNIQVPGDMEGFGLVLLEAAMCERPIVASSLEGIEEAVQNDKNGKLVHTLDTETFRKQLELFLKNSEEAQAFGKQARQFTQQNYSWPTIAERYVEIYRRLDGLQ